MVFNIIHKVTCGNMFSIISNVVYLYYVHLIQFTRKPYCSSVIFCDKFIALFRKKLMILNLIHIVTCTSTKNYESKL